MGLGATLPIVLDRYLAGEISLGKAAELLGISRFELADRLKLRGVPLRTGSATLEEAESEVRQARLHDSPKQSEEAVDHQASHVADSMNQP